MEISARRVYSKGILDGLVDGVYCLEPEKLKDNLIDYYEKLDVARECILFQSILNPLLIICSLDQHLYFCHDQSGDFRVDI